jgi:cellulose biosynthesis protein BcsQ
MLINVANLQDGQSTCALNLACALADMDDLCADRWKGARRVVLFDADPVRGTATGYGSGGHLPVSREYLPLGDSTIEQWLRRVLEIAAAVDYLVVESSPHFAGVATAFFSISDLVVVPCSASAADLAATAVMVEAIVTARRARSDGGPKCLLVPIRPNAGTTQEDDTGEALGAFGEMVGPAIYQRAAFEDAFAGRWIGDFAHYSIAHAAITALAARVETILA